MYPVSGVPHRAVSAGREIGAYLFPGQQRLCGFVPISTADAGDGSGDVRCKGVGSRRLWTADRRRCLYSKEESQISGGTRKIIRSAAGLSGFGARGGKTAGRGSRSGYGGGHRRRIPGSGSLFKGIPAEADHLPPIWSDRKS